MSLKTKKRFKGIGKVVAGALFVILLFTNIKVALMDDTELVNGKDSMLGIELFLFESTFAEQESSYCHYWSTGGQLCHQFPINCLCEIVVN